MRYERPAMEKVALRSNKAVSGKCWGYASSGDANAPTYYYEFDNTEWGSKDTWVGFKLNISGSLDCSSVNGLEFFAVEYGDYIVKNGLQSKAYTLLQDHLTSMGAFSNGASPFKATEGGFATEVGQSW